MVISKSLRRKLLATAVAVVAFVVLYGASVADSHGGMVKPAPVLQPVAGARMDFVATAYCKGQTTSAGVAPQAGIAAADVGLLPEGSVIQVEGVPDRYRGIYTVMDTGPEVVGRHVDLYMWSCIEALTFGRRPISLVVLRLGWNPDNTAPSVK